jgi:hypothetical protein
MPYQDKNAICAMSLLKSSDDLKNEISYEDFEHKKHFIHLCNLIPNKERERFEIVTIDTDNITKRGLVYVFVIEGKIFKIGHSIKDIKKRVQSYNCGKMEYRINGTNSVTNYFVLQSLLNINKVIKVYAFFPQLPSYTIFGKIYHSNLPSSRQAEKLILRNFIAAHNRMPIGCKQK